MSESNSIGDQIEGKLKGAVVNALMSILVAMIRPLATLTEVFFRKEMGERYFTYWNSMAGSFLLLLFGLPYSAIIFGPAGSYVSYGRRYRAEWGGEEYRAIMALLIWFVVFLFCANLHQRAVVRRYQKGLRWHSVNVGIPRFAGLPEVIEKALPFVAGIALIWPLRLYGLGALMILSGLTSILLRVYEAAKFRDRMLDMIDAQIEHDNLAKAVTERLSPSQTEGFQAPLPAYVSDEFRGKFVKAAGYTPGTKPPQIP